jgi:hypothetical protein
MCASAHSSVHGEGGGGGSDRTDPRHRERKVDAWGNGSATSEPGPRGRERRGARVKKPAPTGWPPLGSERERGRARGIEGCR